jgi:hypothetical protein
VEKLHKLAETKTENQHHHKGFNLFSELVNLFDTLRSPAISGQG